MCALSDKDLHGVDLRGANLLAAWMHNTNVTDENATLSTEPV